MPRKNMSIKPGQHIIPNLTHEERARRMENFFDILSRTTGVKGYVGCKANSEENSVEIFIDKSKQ